MAKMTALIVSVPEVAAALGLTRARVAQLAADGVIPRIAKGKYDLVECLKAAVVYYRNLSDSKPDELKEAQIVREKAAAEREVRANLVEARKYVPIKACEVVWNMAVEELRENLEAMHLEPATLEAITKATRGVKLNALDLGE